MCNGLGGWKALLGAECTIKNYTRRTLRSVYGYLNVGSKDKCCVSLWRQVCGVWTLARALQSWRLMLVSGQYLVTCNGSLTLAPSSRSSGWTQEASASSWTNILPCPLPRHSSPPPRHLHKHNTANI